MRSLAVCLSGFLTVGAVAGFLAGGAAATTEGPTEGAKEAKLEAKPVAGAPEAEFEKFLDRLMRAESNGNDLAANPRSTAVGPFQFIKSTFIEVARRHFASEVAALDDDAVLTLRTNRAFARRAASAFCKEALAFLSEQGLNPTFGHLRLAFLVGPSAAVRLLQAAPTTPVADILGGAAITANPFMRGMSAADLIARTDRDVATDRAIVARPARTGPRPSGPVVAVAATCNPGLASCRRWISLRAAALSRQKAGNRSAAPGRRETRPGV